MADQVSPATWNKLYIAKIIKDNKLKFINLRIAEDLNFFMKYIIFCNNIFVMKKCLCKYSILSNSASRKFDSRALEIFDAFDELEKFIKNYEYSKEYKMLLSRIKLSHYSFQFGNIVQCKDKKQRKEMIKEFYKKTKNLKQLSKDGNMKTYLKIKIKKILLPLFIVYKNKKG